jgi:hypothetical protein
VLTPLVSQVNFQSLFSIIPFPFGFDPFLFCFGLSLNGNTEFVAYSWFNEQEAYAAGNGIRDGGAASYGAGNGNGDGDDLVSFVSSVCL